MACLHGGRVPRQPRLTELPGFFFENASKRLHARQVISPWLAEIARLEPFTWQKATPPSRVPWASRQGAPGRWANLSSM